MKEKVWEPLYILLLIFQFNVTCEISIWFRNCSSFIFIKIFLYMTISYNSIILLLMAIGIVSIFWLLWIVLHEHYCYNREEELHTHITVIIVRRNYTHTHTLFTADNVSFPNGVSINTSTNIKRVLIAPHPYQHFFFILVILKEYSRTAISLKTKWGWASFQNVSLTFWMSFGCLLKLFSHFKNNIYFIFSF